MSQTGNPDPKTQKVFVIGFQKSGTSSMQAVLGLLGIKAVKRHAGILDSPSAFVFEHLGKTWPGTKFILTYRDPESRLACYRNFFADENNDLRK